MTYGGHVFTMGAAVSIAHSHLTRGLSAFGGTLASTLCVLRLQHSLVTDATSFVGAALYSTTSLLQLQHTNFLRCSAHTGAALNLARSSVAQLRNCSISHSRATLGGALFLATSSRALLQLSKFNSNMASDQGSAALVESDGSTLTLSHTVVAQNSGAGATLAVTSGGALTVLDGSVLVDNTRSGASAIHDGAAISCFAGAAVSVSRGVLFRRNSPYSLVCWRGCNVSGTHRMTSFSQCSNRRPKPLSLAPPLRLRGTSGGTLTTVYGENLVLSLSDATRRVVTVAVGGRAAPHAHLDPNGTLSFLSPPGIGTQVIDIWMEGRLAPSATLTFEYAGPEVTSTVPHLWHGGGEEVVIFGRNFGGVNESTAFPSVSVRFGIASRPCSNVLRESHTKLRCVAPVPLKLVGVVVVAVAARESAPFPVRYDDSVVPRSITVLPTALTIREGQHGTFSVRLSSPPSHNVTVSVSSPSPSSGLVVSMYSILFNPGSTFPMTTPVRVQSVDDMQVRGDYTIQLHLEVASAAPLFSNVSLAPVSVNVFENDQAGMKLLPSSFPSSSGYQLTSPLKTLPLAVFEGNIICFAVILESQPSSAVTVQPMIPPEAAAAVFPSTMAFHPPQVVIAPTSWSQPAGVCFNKSIDDIAHPTLHFSVGHTVSSSDPLYNATVVPPTAQFTLQDVNVAGVSVSRVSPVLLIEEGATATPASFLLSLTSQPLSAVTISPAIYPPDAPLVVYPASALFLPSNWSVAPKFNILSSVPAANLSAVTVEHTVTSSDNLYRHASVPPVDITVVVRTTVVAPLATSPTGLAVRQRAAFTAEVSWLPPADGSATHITAYVVEVSTSSRFTSGVNASVVSNTQLTVALRPLSLGVELNFRVAARLSASSGYQPLSEPSLTAKLMLTALPGSPSLHSPVRNSGATVALQWSPPTHTGGVPITSYTVEYSTDPLFPPSATQLLPVGGRLKVTVTGLTPSPYVFRVRASNAAFSNGTSVETAFRGAGPLSPSSPPIYEICEVGFYLQSQRPALQDRVCLPCPSGAGCTRRGLLFHEVGSQPGWWSDGKHYYPCPLPSCLANNRCDLASGFQRNSTLCGACAAQYFRNGALCTPCPSVFASSFLILAAFGMLLAVVWVDVYQATYPAPEPAFHPAVPHRAHPRVVEHADMTTRSTVAQRILVSFSVMLSSIGEFRARGPEALRKLAGWTSAVSGSAGLGFSPVKCALGRGYYSRLWGSASLPLVMCSACGPLALLLARRTRHRHNALRCWMGCCVSMLLLLYPSTTKTLLQVFDCYSVKGQPLSRLRSDLTVQCHTTLHSATRLAVLPVLLIYSLGLPLLALVFTVKYRLRLNSPNVKPFFGFIYVGYDLRRCAWWEVLVFLRKFALQCVVVFVHDPVLQSSIATWVIVVALVLQAYWRPYSTPFLNNLALLSLTVTYATQSLSAFYFVAAEKLGQDFETAAGFITWLLVSLNTLCLLALFSAFLHAGVKQRSSTRSNSWLCKGLARIFSVLPSPHVAKTPFGGAAAAPIRASPKSAVLVQVSPRSASTVRQALASAAPRRHGTSGDSSPTTFKALPSSVPGHDGRSGESTVNTRSQEEQRVGAVAGKRAAPHHHHHAHSHRNSRHLSTVGSRPGQTSPQQSHHLRSSVPSKRKSRRHSHRASKHHHHHHAPHHLSAKEGGEHKGV